MEQVLKNHVAVCLDTSSSMIHLLPQVVKVFNNQIQYLRDSSIQFEQETRISIYEFSSEVSCQIYDVDVARPMEINRLSGRGMTALMDACGLAVEDLQLLPQKYGDHAFMLYVLTDGMENRSRNYNKPQFRRLLENLPDNFTVAAFAPNEQGMAHLSNLGFPKGNIDLWDANSAKGVVEVGQRFERTMDNFYKQRKTGVRSTTSMFSDLNKVSVADIKAVAKEVRNFKIAINQTTQAVEIRPLVEDQTGVHYTKGCAFYELVKNEHVQPSKEVAVQNKRSGKVYRGREARQILNLPDHEKVKVTPVHNSKWDVYVQSRAVNRKIIPKQRVIVFP